jgi:hypothetical protein
MMATAEHDDITVVERTIHTRCERLANPIGKAST